MNPGSFLRKFGSQSLILIFFLFIIFLQRLIAGGLYLKLAEQYEVQGSFAKASLSYEDSANRLWWLKGLLERSALSAKKAGNNKAAIELFLEADIHDGLTPIGKITLGDLLNDSGEYLLAIGVWDGIGKGIPESEAALVRIAKAYRQLGDLQEAINNWQEATRLNPENDEAHFNLGLLLMTTQPQKALLELMQAARINQEWDARVQVLRAGLNLALLNDNIPYQLVVSGQSLASIGEWELSQEAFLRALNLANDYPAAWAWLGEAYQHIGKDGLPALKKALEMDQNSAFILALNGLYYRRQNQIDLAWSAYSKAAGLEPNNPAWQLAMGDLSAQKGDLLQAQEYYKKAVNLEPQDPEGWRGLAVFFIQYDVEVSTLGMNAAIQLLKLAPKDWQSYNIMGQVLMAVGELDSAKLYFLDALKISPDQAEIYLHLGYLMLMQNQREEAYTNLTMALKLDLNGSISMQAQRLKDQYFP
jgi:tetratricopeptide (TPR) repeat protein